MAYDSYLVREEDGTSHYTLEDGSGDLILETAQLITVSTTTSTSGSPLGLSYAHQPDLTLQRLHQDEEEALLLTIVSLN